jgi:hypothetical protein
LRTPRQVTAIGVPICSIAIELARVGCSGPCNAVDDSVVRKCPPSRHEAAKLVTIVVGAQDTPTNEPVDDTVCARREINPFLGMKRGALVAPNSSRQTNVLRTGCDRKPTEPANCVGETFRLGYEVENDRGSRLHCLRKRRGRHRHCRKHRAHIRRKYLTFLRFQARDYPRVVTPMA